MLRRSLRLLDRQLPRCRALPSPPLARPAVRGPRSGRWTSVWTPLRTYSAPASSRGFGPDDTIYALSSGQGRAGIAVIRISGPSCLDIYHALCPGKAGLKARYATVRRLLDPQTRSVLDPAAMVVYLAAPETVTGEDVLELHVHGGPAIVKAVLSAIPRCLPWSSSEAGKRIRHAEPGEFTRRAFLNDRVDLTQVESLGDMLTAETEQQRRAAVRGSSGRLGRRYEEWRAQLLAARGEIEALIDFSEDQHFDESPAELLGGVTQRVRAMLASMEAHERGARRSELLRGGIRIALVGPANAGKSSLMNLIVGREAAIVSSEAGTTRDVVEANLDIGGYLCSFADTAGFRQGEVGAVETEGVRRARDKARASQVVIVMASVEDGPTISYDEETVKLGAEAQCCIVVVNKRDYASDQHHLQHLVARFSDVVQAHMGKQTEVLTISCKDAQGGGVEDVVDRLLQGFASMTDAQEGGKEEEEEDTLGVTARQGEMLGKCRAHLEAYVEEAAGGDSVVAAEYLRYAADCLSRMTGKGEAGDVEDVLGVVFEKFCVGK